MRRGSALCGIGGGRLASCAAVALLMVALGLGALARGGSPAGEEVRERGALAWLGALSSGDYAACDAMSAADGFKILGYGRSVQAFLSPLSSDVYYGLLGIAADSVQSMKVVGVKEKDGYTEYSVELEYLPYRRIQQVEIDKDKLKEMALGYLDSKIPDAEFSELISSYYKEEFARCFTTGGSDAVKVTLTLSEKESTDGLVYVYGTQGFMDGYIHDEMRWNLSVYQEGIAAAVKMALRMEGGS